MVTDIGDAETVIEKVVSKCGTALFLSFVLVIAILGTAFPVVAAEKTIGVIMTGNIPYYKDIHKGLIEGLTEEGLFAAGKVDVVVQSPTPEVMSWTNAARKLVAVGSSVIIAYGAPATIAAMGETSDIPIVFAGVYDPQAVGVTGKNATGVSSKVPVASLIKNLKSIGNFSKLGVVFNDVEKDTVVQANEVKQLEGSLGFQSVRFNIKKAEDASKIANIEGLFLTTGCAAMHCVNNIVVVARKAKIPTAATIEGGEASGVILTLAANPSEQGKEAAKMAAKVIKGAKPSALPVEQPKKIDMIINLKEATDMGLKVPLDLLTSATKVIK
ncbi:MAG TPA: ABC transporter substrate-binding protein [Thermodesulfovibrionales bacterium]|nr:ABC transporter substrate-binding protein [Thermodesulfovibrionales bacterium]